MDARKMLEKAKYTVPVIDSNMEVISETLDLVQRLNNNLFPLYKSDSLDRMIDYFEGVIESESKHFQQTVELIGQLEDQRYKTVLYLRYIENKSATEIEKVLDWDSSTIYKTTKKAIDELDKILLQQRSKNDLQTVSTD